MNSDTSEGRQRSRKHRKSSKTLHERGGNWPDQPMAGQPPTGQGIDPRMYTFDPSVRSKGNTLVEEKPKIAPHIPHIAADHEKVAIIDDLDISVPGLYGTTMDDDDSSEETPALLSHRSRTRTASSYSSNEEPEKTSRISPILRQHSNRVHRKQATSSMNSSKHGENFYSRISDDNTLPRPNFFVPPPPTSHSPPMPPRYPTSFKNRPRPHLQQQHYSNDEELPSFRYPQQQHQHHQQQQQQLNPLSSTTTNSSRRVEYDDSVSALDDFQLRFLAQAPNGRVFVPPGLPSQSNSPISDLSQPKMADFNSCQPLGAVYYRNNRSSMIGSPSNLTNSDRWGERGVTNPNQSMLSTHVSSYYTEGKPQTITDEGDSKCPYSDVKFIYGKNLRRILTWKCATVVLACFSLILLAFLCYFIGTYFKSRQPPYYFQPTSGDYALSSSSSSSSSSSQSTNQYVFGRKETFHLRKSEGWRTVFYLPRQERVRMRLGAPEVAVFGLYGSRDVLPSHARFEFFHPFNSRRQARVAMTTVANGAGIKKRSISKGLKVDLSSNPTTTMEVLKILDAGVWHIFIHNDLASLEATFTFQATVHDVDGQDGDDDDEDGCRNNCYDRGDCVDGKCRCYEGHSGPKCLQVVCPTICSGNGVFSLGRCQCNPGWTGKNCELETSSTCWNVTCLNGAICLDGACMCAPGFVGGSCEREICTPECFHGLCEERSCVCHEGWEGATCTIKKCDPRCSDHRGTCNNGSCLCNVGWYGRHCSIEGCPNGCSSHGRCEKVNPSSSLTSSLLLSPPSSSSSSSSSSSYSSAPVQWHCRCNEGWTGPSCGVAVEIVCDDNLDNDHDTLLDCNDPDCCLKPLCKDSIPCRSSPNPMEILLRKQSPSSTDSFYERVKFLIEDNSVQIHSSPTSFNQTSQVSVIRGKVVDQNNSPIIGVRVNVSSQPLYGFTLSREHGLFDILVNGGGSVTLNFMRQSFKPRKKTVTVPWNRIITMDTVVMATEGQNETLDPEGGTCLVPHPLLHRPQVLSVWEHSQERACPSISGIIPESQVLQESLNIPGTNVHLVYRSSSSSGYMSTLIIKMTGLLVPKNLAFVWLKIQIEGLKYEKQFEADPLLVYKFAWDRRNAYNQKVFGVVTAIVSVGYEYTECKKIFWEVKSAAINGFDISSSELGKWNLNIHHAYNYQDGILHRGDGTSVYLKQQPPKFITILGNGNSRKPDCSNCDGRTSDAKLSAPVALASGRDGSLYIGDYNFIRMVDPSRERITSILKLSHSKVSYKYYMTVNPVDGKLYISDSHSFRIIMVKTMGPDKNLEENFDKVAGTGEQCYPGDQDVCGDGGLAKNAKLFHPKGIAVNKDGIVYFADGANVRSIDHNKRIQTVIGSQGLPRSWKPFPCSGFARADEVFLHWPTSLAINPLDDSLHILDNNLVLKLTRDNLVLLVAGSLLHCPSSGANGSSDSSESSPSSSGVLLRHSQHITFSADGQLFVVESNGKELNRVRVSSGDGSMNIYAGSSSGCDCSDDKCNCFEPKEQLAKNMLLNNPSSVTISPDGVVHIADMGNLRVHSVVSTLPAHDKIGQYEVLNSEAQELYTFNRYGQHISTKNIVTNTYTYNFTYSVNSYYGKLTTFVDGSGIPINIVRDYRLQVKELQSPNGQISRFILSSMGQLQTFVGPNSNTVNFTYLDNSGLVSSKITSDRGTSKVVLYEYDKLGRVVSSTDRNGGRERLDLGVDRSGSLLLAKRGLVGGASTTLKISQNAFIFSVDDFKMKMNHPVDGFVRVEYPFGMEVSTGAEPHPLLNMDQPLVLRRKITLPKNKTYTTQWKFYHYHDIKDRKSIFSKNQKKVLPNMGWEPRYGALKGHRSQIKVRHVDHYRYDDQYHDMPRSHQSLSGYKGKALFINQEHVLSIEFDRLLNSELVLDKHHEELFSTTFDQSGLPVRFAPVNPGIFKLIGPSNRTYNDRGRLVSTQFDTTVTTYEYLEPRGLLLEERANGRVVSKYSYGGPNNELLISRTLTNGAVYKFDYDSSGRLESLTMPDGDSSYRFNVVNVLGISRVFYASPIMKSSEFVVDLDHLGRISREAYPSRKRVVLYDHDPPSGDLVVASFDEGSASHGINRKTMKIKESTFTSNNAIQNYTSVVTQDSESPLSEWQVVRLNLGNEEVATARGVSRVDVSYTYNDLLLVSKITSTFAELLKTTQVEYSYDAQTSRPSKIGPIRIQWQNYGSRRIVSDENVEIISEWEDQGLHFSEKLMFSGDRTTFESWSRRDGNGRLIQWRRKVGSSDSKTFDYSYYSLGLPNEVSVDGKVVWKYFYDANGILMEVAHFGERRSLASSISFDEDGFMTAASSSPRTRGGKAEFILEHNSLGQLVSVIDPSKSSVVVSFFYDSRSRLVMARYRDFFLQYFYTDPTDVTRLTHVYDGSIKKLNLLFYHEDGRLFAITRQSETFYVSTDSFGSPVVVVNSMGKLMQQISYDPLGSITEEVMAGFPLYLGFCGGIRENATGLLYVKGRWYDPTNARYTSTSHHALLQLISKNVHFNLRMLNTHSADTGIWSQPEHHKMDTKVALSKIGYNLDRLVPSVSLSGRLFEQPENGNGPVISAPEHFLDDKLAQLSPILYCSFRREIVQKISKFSLVTKSLISGSKNMEDSTDPCNNRHHALFDRFSLTHFIPQDINFSIDGEGMLLFQSPVKYSQQSFPHQFVTMFNSSKLLEIRNDDSELRLSLHFLKRAHAQRMFSDTQYFTDDHPKQFDTVKVTKRFDGGSQRTIVTVENDLAILTLDYDVVE